MNKFMLYFIKVILLAAFCAIVRKALKYIKVTLIFQILYQHSHKYTNNNFMIQLYLLLIKPSTCKAS